MLSWLRWAAARWAAAGAATLLLAGCASAQAERPYAAREVGRGAPPSVQYAPWTAQDYRYRVGPGDELALRFLLEPDLNASVIVGPDGRGVFPLISGQTVAGQTAEEINANLARAYAAVLRNPQVETLVSSYGAAQIYVGGEVREPGVKTIKGQVTVAQAVMTAGGFQDTARTGKVVVLRQRPGDPRLLMRTVDLRAALAGKDGGDFAILPGDLVFVPRSAIAEVDLFVRQYITGALPFTFSYTINNGARY